MEDIHQKYSTNSLVCSSSVVAAIDAVGVTVADDVDDWWWEWWFLWRDNDRCDWRWWECKLFELVEFDVGSNPCDFVIVNSPFDVVNLKNESQTIINEPFTSFYVKYNTTNLLMLFIVMFGDCSPIWLTLFPVLPLFPLQLLIARSALLLLLLSLLFPQA